MLERNYPSLIQRLQDWIRERVQEAGCEGVVLGLSGGIDSSVCAALCQGALSREVLGLILPCHSHPSDAAHAQQVATLLGLEYRILDLGPVYDHFLSILQGEEGKMAAANLKPRLRMTTLYYYANQWNYLVVGTDNRSELFLGYFTKYGDGGVDITPLGSLVKGEVYELARYLKIPEEIIQKPPSAGLWAGQEDETEMGLTYEEVDSYILTGEAPQETANSIEGLARKNRHKLHPPLQPDFP